MNNLPENVKRPKKLIDFLTTRITDESIIAPIETIVAINGSTVAIKGGLFLISGVQKSGKSFVGKVLIIKALGGYSENSKIEVSLANGKRVAFFNTEMSRPDIKKYHDEILTALNLEKTPHNLDIQHIVDMTKQERLKHIETYIETYPDTHLIIIDGAADLVDSTNDEKESATVIETLLRLADRYGICIGGVVHENSKSQTTRGHFGQIFERKSTGAISVKKDKETQEHCVESNVLRHSSDFPPVWFKRTETGIEYLEKDITSKQQKLSGDYTTTHQKIAVAFKGEAAVPKLDLLKRLMANDQTPKTDDAKRSVAKRLMEKAEASGIITYKASNGAQFVVLQTKTDVECPS
jgi:AAA domain